MGRKRQSPLLRNSQYGHRSKAKHDFHHGAECDRRSEQTGFEYFRCIRQSGIGGRAATRSGHDALLLRYRLRLPLYPGSDGGRGRAGPLPAKSQEGVLQTLRGAIALLESNGSHPEQEVDRVTTAGGITIKGLNEMEHAGFTSAVIRGSRQATTGNGFRAEYRTFPTLQFDETCAGSGRKMPAHIIFAENRKRFGNSCVQTRTIAPSFSYL